MLIMTTRKSFAEWVCYGIPRKIRLKQAVTVQKSCQGRKIAFGSPSFQCRKGMNI